MPAAPLSSPRPARTLRDPLCASAPLREPNLTSPKPTVASAIRAALLTADPYAKAMATRAVRRDWRQGRLAFVFDVAMPDMPARPDRPELLSPGKMPKRGRGQSLKGRIALYHALTHIEFVAIDLALDMAGRFGGEMTPGFVGDFLDIAADEAMHFVLLDRLLRPLGVRYGDLPAHGGLWDCAIETRHDVAARLAVVPMVLEARGLDVTPATIDRLREAGDDRGAKVLQRIFDDEIRHVRLGAEQFQLVAGACGEEPGALWRRLVNMHFHGRIAGPFNDSARRAAGLSPLFDAALV
jgi:uncharacterized ferritin-like protein (DUF455 family)